MLKAGGVGVGVGGWSEPSRGLRCQANRALSFFSGTRGPVLRRACGLDVLETLKEIPPKKDAKGRARDRNRKRKTLRDVSEEVESLEVPGVGP